MAKNSTDQEKFAEDVAIEVDGDTPDVLVVEANDGKHVFKLPRAWRRFKFMRELRSGDLIAAVEVIWPPVKDKDGNDVPHEVITELEELEVDSGAFEKALEDLAKSVGGLTLGN